MDLLNQTYMRSIKQWTFVLLSSKYLCFKREKLRKKTYKYETRQYVTKTYI